MRIFSFFLSAAFLLVFASCEESSSESSVRFGDMFENVADNIIQPRYAAFSDKVDDLHAKTAAFIATPDVANLGAVKTSYAEAYMSWQTVSAFNFGPADEFDTQMRENINSFPVNKDQVESNIANGEMNLGIAANLSAKGFPALDFILYGLAEDDAALIASFTTGENAAAQKEYLAAVVSDIKNRVDKVVLDWGTYRETFVSSTGTDKSSSLSLLYNQFLYDYEQVKRNKLAFPAGFATKFGIAIDKDATAVEAYYSEMSVVLAVNNLKALRKLYLGIGEDGTDGEGFYEKLKEYNAQATVVDGDLADAIATQFDVVIQGFSVVDQPLSVIIENNNQNLKDLSDELQKMVPMIKNDMRSYLSVSLTEGDTDGD